MKRKSNKWSSTWLIVGITLLGLSGAALAQGDAALKPPEPAPYIRNGDVVQIGSPVTVPAGMLINGDVVVIGGPVEVDGDVNGDLVAVGGPVRVAGRVHGDTVAVGGPLDLDATAVIDGDAVAVGSTLTAEPGARVNGNQTEVGLLRGGLPWMHWGQWGHWNAWLDLAHFPFLFLYLAGLFSLALIVTALWPGHVERVMAHIESQPGRSFAVGLLAYLLFIPLAIVSVVTIVGPLVVIAGFFVARFFGYVAVVSMLGRRILERLRGDRSPVWELLIGVLTLGLVRAVPVVGFLIAGAASAFGLGAVLDTKFGTNRPWLPPKKENPSQGDLGE